VSENKSTYEKLIEELHAEGKITSLTPEEHFNLFKELNNGMVEFCLEQKRNRAKAEIEAKNLNLD